MVMSQCYGIIKYTLVCVNLVFWALGLAAVVLGVWMLVDNTFIVSLTQEESNYHAGLYIMVAAGALLLIVSFLGCCGAFRESQCLLVSFFSCLLVIVVAQIAAGAWLYTHRDTFGPLVKRAFTETIKKDYGVIEYRTATIDAFQSNLGCCGANGPDDWAGSEYNTKGSTLSGLSVPVTSNGNNNYELPESCCKEKGSEACRRARQVKIGGFVDNAIYSEGCVDKLISKLNDQGCSILIAIIALGIVELIGLIFSLVLCCAIGSSDRYKA
ncbi:CD9 antigen [Fopius arisanus]|uniref:Tetraspanin n=1 Tax=Fopius arisanus TaxID=64838 RepID=A0A9R1T8S2_9HYME|nr:PREDICTED: CD9 antigen-like [Fopius arisanus]